jgi:hypothetical protein
LNKIGPKNTGYLRGKYILHPISKCLSKFQNEADEFVKILKSSKSVIPAKAGTQSFRNVLDPGFRRGDGVFDFLRVHQD